jgi:hypothetical protein
MLSIACVDAACAVSLLLLVYWHEIVDVSINISVFCGKFVIVIMFLFAISVVLPYMLLVSLFDDGNMLVKGFCE